MNRIATTVCWPAVVLLALACAAGNAGQVTPINLPEDSLVANERARALSVTPDGRYIAFVLDTNIATGVDEDGLVYRIDRQTGETVLVTIPDTYAVRFSFLRVGISDDGSRVSLTGRSIPVPRPAVAFNGVWVRDLETGDWLLGSAYDGGGTDQGFASTDYVDGEISADGNLVVFASDVDGLVAGDDDGRQQVFVHDLQTLETSLVGGQFPVVDGFTQTSDPVFSGDAGTIAFISNNPDLLPGNPSNARNVYLRDLRTDELIRASVGPTGELATANVGDFALGDGGRFAVFESSFEVDGEPLPSPFIFDRTLQTSVSLAAEFGERMLGAQWLGEIAGEGRYVTYFGEYIPLSNPTDADTDGWFVVDRQTDRIARLEPMVDGERVVFFEPPNLLLDPLRVVFVTGEILTEPLAVAYEHTLDEVDLAMSIVGPSVVPADSNSQTIYELRVDNNGATDAREVVLSLTLSNGRIIDPPPDCGAPSLRRTIFNCIVGDIPAGTSRSISVTHSNYVTTQGIRIDVQASPRGDFVVDPDSASASRFVSISTPPSNDNGDGGGGGSTSPLSMLLLYAVACLHRKRRRQI